ncbi:MAG: hypothetical protein ACR2IK_25505 [Chloroflexota bacterium]
MRKLLAILAIALAAIAATVANAVPASAFGSEQLGCYVSPSHTAPQPSPYCSDGMPSTSYSATFGVLNESGAYSYAWSVPTWYTSKIAMGCTAGYDYCVLSNLRPVGEITVSVTISQNGQSSTLSATADIEPWCGNYFCG